MTDKSAADSKAQFVQNSLSNSTENDDGLKNNKWSK